MGKSPVLHPVRGRGGSTVLGPGKSTVRGLGKGFLTVPGRGGADQWFFVWGSSGSTVLGLGKRVGQKFLVQGRLTPHSTESQTRGKTLPFLILGTLLGNDSFPSFLLSTLTVLSHDSYFSELLAFPPKDASW